MKIMIGKKQLLIGVFLFTTKIAFAQPGWVEVLPKPTNNTYYYLCATGRGANDKEVYNSAIQDLNRQIIDHRGPGVETKVSEDGSTVFQIINGQQYKIKRWQVRVWPVDQPETLPDGTKVQYYLYQVAVAGNIDVRFDYNVSQPIDGMAVLKSSLVPGLGQFHKGQTGKGIGFLVGEVVCVGSIVAGQSMRHTYINKMNSTTNASLKKQYADRANMCTTARNISIGAAAAVYVWNVLDAVVSEGGHSGVVSCGGPVNISPVVTDESVALSVSIKF